MTNEETVSNVIDLCGSNTEVRNQDWGLNVQLHRNIRVFYFYFRTHFTAQESTFPSTTSFMIRHRATLKPSLTLPGLKQRRMFVFTKV